jgi:serine/threonine-protein kinase RsbT
MDEIVVDMSIRRMIAHAHDVAAVRRAARTLAHELGLDFYDGERVAIAVTELATNLIRHAGAGHITLQSIEGAQHRGIQIECVDQGPGLPDIELALEDGFSTAGGLGSGLPAVRRLMDDLRVESSSCGTTIIARKWLTRT